MKNLNEFLSEQNISGVARSINEGNILTLINKHSENGYIIISGCRGGKDFGVEGDEANAVNNDRTEKLLKDITAAGFSYTPVYGGFKENIGTDKETSVYERSFIVYAMDKHGKQVPFEELFAYGQKWCQDYNQDSFLSKAPGDVPKYITKDGKVDMEFSGNIKINDLASEYFTDRHKNTNKFGKLVKPTRITFEGVVCNPEPMTYSGRHSRWMKGEIF